MRKRVALLTCSLLLSLSGSLRAMAGGDVPSTIASESLPSCEGESRAEADARTGREIRELKGAAGSNPWFGYLRRKSGRVKGCAVLFSDAARRVKVSFSRGATLVVGTDSTIELSETEVGGIDIDLGEVTKLLRESEQALYPPRGCGMDWSHPESLEGGAGKNSRVVVFRGDVCNCQARLELRGQRVIGVSLRAAC